MQRLSIPLSARIGVTAVASLIGLSGCGHGRAAATHPGEASATTVMSSNASVATGRYAMVNGLRMYYEVHGAMRGTTRPLVLLHGGGSTIETTFGRVLPALAASRQVIAVELQGHGHTADRPRPLHFAHDADDVAVLLGELAVPEVDVLGFSNGANVALELARRNPGVVRRMVVAAGFVTKDGIPAAFWESFRQPPDVRNMPPSLRDAYLRAAPDPSRLPDLVTKLMERLNGFRDWSDNEVRSIQIPTLLMIGDSDVITVEHTARMSRLMPRAQLAVLPGSEHGTYLGEATAPPCAVCVTAAMGLVLRFLDSPSVAAR